MNFQDLLLLLPPLLAGIIVLGTHAPLGQRVLERGIIFIDLAVAQLAGLGVIFVHVIHDQPQGWMIQLAAFLAALLGAMGLHWAEKYWQDILEAIIGVVFVLSVTAALLLLADDPHGGERLKELLSGQLLWVSFEDLLYPGILSALILLAWFKGGARQSPILFYGLFALSVTMSVQLVGVYLVFSSLIIPALATRSLKSLKSAYIIGILGYLTGLIWSFYSDLPTGPIVVWSMTIIALLYSFQLRLFTRDT